MSLFLADKFLGVDSDVVTFRGKRATIISCVANELYGWVLLSWLVVWIFDRVDHLPLQIAIGVCITLVLPLRSFRVCVEFRKDRITVKNYFRSRTFELGSDHIRIVPSGITLGVLGPGGNARTIGIEVDHLPAFKVQAAAYSTRTEFARLLRLLEDHNVEVTGEAATVQPWDRFSH